MISRLLAILLVVSVIFASGCVQQETGGATGGAAGATLEDQAADMLEQELDQAIENISVEDIENSLPE